MKQDRGRLLSWAHRGMNILGWFHYLTGAVQLLLTVTAFSVGSGNFVLLFRQNCPAGLSFLLPLSDAALFALILTFMGIRILTEWFVGWNCRRKSRILSRQTLTLILSGGKILYALLLILRGGILTARWVNLHALLLNGVTFLLAFWMRRTCLREERRT